MQRRTPSNRPCRAPCHRTLPISRTPLLLAVTASVLALFTPPPARAQPVTPTSSPPRVGIVEPAVWSALDATGQVPIVVEYRDAVRAIGGPTTTSRRLTRRVSASRIIAAVPQGSVSAHQQVENWPMFAVLADRAAVEALSRSPEVLRISENRSHATALSVSVPKIGGPIAHAAGFTGSGQTIAVLDTGVDSAHPFLGGRVVAEACFSSTIPSLSYTAVCPGADPTTAVGPGSAAPCPVTPDCRHGTHVAGIAAGSDLSQTGVAKDANIIAVQVFSRVDSESLCGSSPPCALYNDFDLVRGLDFVYSLRDTYDIASANMSLGGFLSTGYCDYAEQERPFSDLRAAGIAPVVASGNDGSKIALGVPACTSNAVSVGATNKSTDAIATFSNSNQQLSLLAPGVSINSSVPGGGFASLSGTSMATPHVAGAFAVVRQQHPSWSVADIAGVLRATGLPLSDPGNGVSTPRIRLDGATRPPTFHPLEPVRLFDSRVFAGPLGPGGSLDLPIGGADVLPSTGVAAVVVNLTGIAGSATHLTMFPTGFPVPASSNLNLGAGETRANQALVKLGPAGMVTIVNNDGSTHFIVDIVGWIDDGGTNDSGDHFESMLPKRVADTRDGTGAPPGKVGPGGSIDIDVASSCPSPGATGAAVNITITGATAFTHLTMFPTGGPMPGVSNLNSPPGATVPNLASAKLGTGGKVTVVNNAGDADIIVDLFGCYTAGPDTSMAGRFVPMEPARIIDTRAGLGVNSPGKIRNGTVTAMGVGGRGGAPSSGMKAALVNITATNNELGTHLSVAPTGLPALTLLQALNTSVLNIGPGQTVANMVQVPVGPDGKFLISNFNGGTDVIVDVYGWIAS